MRVVRVVITAIVVTLAGIGMILGLLIWFSVTWPWYLWKVLHRVAHPR